MGFFNNNKEYRMYTEAVEAVKSAMGIEDAGDRQVKLSER